jgi:iron complex outermembrane receptor protein
MMRSLRCTLALAALAPALVGAQQPAPTTRADSSAKPLHPVVVQERQRARAVGGSAIVEVSVDSVRTAPAANLDAVLRTVPFVGVRTNSRGETELSLRASDSRQPAVLLEGVPLTLGWDSRTDASVIPLSAATGIRVGRTLSSLMLGPNVSSGTIEVGLTEGLIAPRRVLTLGTDQTGALGFAGSVGAPIPIGSGTLAVLGGGGMRHRPDLIAPDALRRRVTHGRRDNTDLTQRDYVGGVRYTTAQGASFGVTLTGGRGTRGIMAEDHLQTPRYWRIPQVDRDVAILSAFSGWRPTPFGSGSVDLRLGRTRGTQRIDQYTDSSYRTVGTTERGDDVTSTTRLILEHSIGARGEVGLGISSATIDYDERLGTATPVAYRQRLASVALETDWSLPGLVRLSLAGSRDQAENPLTGGRAPLGDRSDWGGRLGVTKTLLAPGIQLNAAMTRRARFPALRELYSGSLQRFVPNPDLRPERLVSSEVSALWQRGAGEVQATVFRQHLDDAVVRVTRPDRTFMRVNANAQRTQGLELFGAWRGADRTFLADLTVQDPQLIDQGSGARTAPEYVPHLRGSVTAIVPIAAHTRLTTAATTIGAQSCLNPERGARETIAAATRLDALVDRDLALGARGLWSALRLSVGIDNLLDRLTYDQCGVPQVGRTLRVGLQLR